MEVCERRAMLAERIGDAETVRVAREFGAKHREKAAVLEQKVAAAEAELALRRREADEMVVRYKEAETNRFALLAQLRRTAATERMREANAGETGAFADFARMEEKVEHGASYVDALDELDESPPPTRDPSASRQDLEERLRELKRRMGRAE